MIHWHYLAWFAAFICICLALLGYFGAGMASRQVTSEDLRFPRRAGVIGIALIAITFLAGCATTRAEPESRVETQQVFIEVPVTCVPDNLGNEPSYPDTDEALAAAEDFAERYNLLWAGRLIRQARAGEVEPVITKCREAASE